MLWEIKREHQHVQDGQIHIFSGEQNGAITDPRTKQRATAAQLLTLYTLCSAIPGGVYDEPMNVWRSPNRSEWLTKKDE